MYENNKFFFIEMNTRLQVEHPITEAVFGIDLVKEQICVAYGIDMSLSQEHLEPKGHAIECRINAEKLPNFSPSPGNIKNFIRLEVSGLEWIVQFITDLGSPLTTIA